MVNRLVALLVGLCIFIPGTAAAAVSAQLSSTDIDELETVRLTIRASETRNTETLDLTALEGDFHVMGTNTSSQFRFINGREQSWVDYQITLQPKGTGTLTIPSIQVGSDRTPTLKLQVRPLSKDTRNKIDSMVFFETEVSADTVYVQAQLILTRRLLYSDGVQLYSDLPGAPEVDNAVVLPLGETISGRTQRSARTYGVVEQRYAIFPEASGSLTIPAINVTASVRLVENGRFSRKGVRVGTAQRSIEVKPVPAGFPPDQPWLPAEEVALHQEIQPSGAVDVGDTLTHELLVHVRGNVGSITPPIKLGIDESKFRVYPQSPVINDESNGPSITGARLQTTSLIPTQPGSLSIDQQQLYWWDTVNDTLQIATTPALALRASGQAINSASDPIDSAGVTDTDAGAEADAEPEEPLESPVWRRPQPGLTTILLGALAGFVVLAALLTGARLLWRRSGSAAPSARQLRQIVRNADSDREFLQALAAYLAHIYQQNWHRAREVFLQTHPDLRQDLLNLEAALYYPDKPGVDSLAKSSRERLCQCLDGLGRQHADVERPNPLPELYPN